MRTVTVRTLATEINVSHDTLIAFLKKKGYANVKSIMSKVEPDALDAVMKQFGKQKDVAQKRQKKVAAFKEKRINNRKDSTEKPKEHEPIVKQVGKEKNQAEQRQKKVKSLKMNDQLDSQSPTQKRLRISREMFAEEILTTVYQLQSVSAKRILHELSRELRVQLTKFDVQYIMQRVLKRRGIFLQRGYLVYVPVAEAKVASAKKKPMQNSDDKQSKSKLLHKRPGFYNSWFPPKPPWVVDNEPG
jgi:hypothetical protein